MKNLLNLGKALSKAEQRVISGGQALIDKNWCAKFKKKYPNRSCIPSGG